MKKKMVCLVLAAMLVIAFSGVASAGTWTYCNVIEVGQVVSGAGWIKLQEISGAWSRYYSIPGPDAAAIRAGMAVFLTAQSSGTQVYVLINNATTSGMGAYYNTTTPITTPQFYWTLAIWKEA